MQAVKTYDPDTNYGTLKLIDGDGVGLFGLEWFWSHKQQRAIVWHSYKYDRTPDLYEAAKQALS